VTSSDQLLKNQVVFSYPAEDKELRKAIKTAMAI
jgi:hypothetical protein